MTAKESNHPEQRPKGRPSLEEAGRIDRAILEAARKVLLEQGEAASLNAVAREAGLSRKSVYARYGNREELFIAAIRLTLQDVGPIRFADAGTFEDRLYNCVVAALDIVFSSAAMTFQQVLSTNLHVVPEMRSEMIAASRKIFFEPLVHLLETAQRNGEITLDEPQLTARVIFNATIAYRMTSGPDDGGPDSRESSIQRYARQLAKMVSRGIATD